MSLIAGFAILTLVSYFFILINVPILVIPVGLVLIILYVKFIAKRVKQLKIKFDLLTIITILVFIVGIAGQMAIISPSGIFDRSGNLLFWSANGHDGAWHIALMEEINKGWSFQNPVFAGEKLVNYHFFSDILPALTGKYLQFSNIDLYFRIFPFIFSLFLGISAYFLTKKLTKNPIAPLWATIFTYFSGSFGFIVAFIKNKTIGGESIFWATQPQSASGNPPQIASDFLLLAAIYFLIKFKETKEKRKKIILFIINTILFGTLIEFKVYVGIAGLVALGITGLWYLLFKKNIEILLLTISSGILSFILYFPNTVGSTSFLIFQPWWYIRTMVVEPSRLNWLDLELRRQFYLDRGGFRAILRIIEYEGIAFLIFFFGNLGMRFFGLKQFLKTDIFIKIILIFSLIFPLLFLQKGVASNTSQFLQYFVLLFGILAGIEVSKITTKYKFLIPVIIILMIPTQIGLIYEFYSRPAFAKISQSELMALNFVKQNTIDTSIIITPPYNQYLDLKVTTPNIWDWFDTSYVSAFTSRRTYFDDYEQVDIMGYDYKSRLAIKKTIFNSSDVTLVKNAFISTKANIIYFPKILVPKVSPKLYGLTQIFINDQIEVWKAN